MRTTRDAGTATVKQGSLFDDAGSALPALGVPGSKPTLSKAQKRFNQLVDRIAAQRRLLQQWREFVPVYQQRFVTEIAPLDNRLREGRIAMVELLDRAMDHKALGKTHRAKVRDILLGQLTELLAGSEEPALVRLYDKYSEVSFSEEKEADLDFARAMAGEVFGIELDERQSATTPEELAQRITEQLEAAAAQRAQQSAARTARKKSPKAAARAAMREQAAQAASRAIREVFRKIASELHPDREPDATERTRKTALMQQANQAYAAGDLLALLELQLSIEQIDAGTLGGIADERLTHYNHVLEEQLQRLQEELTEITAPFEASLDGRVARPLMPTEVQQSLDEDVRQLQAMVQGLEADLVAFRDIDVLKRHLRHYRIGQGATDELEFLEQLLAAPQRCRPRR